MRDGRAWVVAFGLVAAAACGGGGKKDPGGGGGGVGGDDSGGGGGGEGDVMVPPEKMDEIGVRLDRKRNAAARCLSDAVLAGTAPKNSKGKITLEFVISTSGQAEQIKVAKASLDVPAVQECIIAKVKEIGFPELPRPLEWSYTFALESM